MVRHGSPHIDVSDSRRRAADGGSAIGMYYLGLAHLAGQGVEADPAAGLEWLEQAARLGMSEAQFEQILSKQMPIEQKREKSDYVIETDTLDHARIQVAQIVADIKRKIANA